jgi:hypothetical protein
MTMIYAHHSPDYTQHAVNLNPVAKLFEWWRQSGGTCLFNSGYMWFIEIL